MPSSNPDHSEDEQDTVVPYQNVELYEDQSNFERNESFGSESEDDGNKNEDAAKRIDPSTSKKSIVRNPLPKLNTERMKGPKGIQTIEKYFEGFKFYGKGHEKTDLDRIMKRLEHWGHRLFPKLDFDDFLEKVENLGSKKDLQVFIHKYRLDMIKEDNDIIIEDNMDVEDDREQDEPIDEFDLLIAEQIERQKRVMNQSVSELSTSNNDAFDKLLLASNASEMFTASQPQSVTLSQLEPSTSCQPQPVILSEPEATTSQPKPVTLSQSESITSFQSQHVTLSQSAVITTPSQLTDEMKERMERNRKLAIEKKIEKLEKRLEELRQEKLKKKANANANAENSETTNANAENNEIINLENQVLTPNL